MNSNRAHLVSSVVGAGLGLLSALSAKAADLPPAVMHFCHANCMTLVLKNGQYVRVDGVAETWTIERFTPSAVILHRHDPPAAWNGFKGDVSYAGQVSNDRLLVMTVDGERAAGMTLAWGSALNSVPANNAERDRHLPNQQPGALPSTPVAALPPVAADPLHAACPSYETRPPSAPIGFDAWRKGDDKLHIEGDGAFRSNWGHTQEALAWFCKAAAAGNGRAAFAIGQIMEVGYIINKAQPGGQVTTTNISGDRMASYYWYEVAAKLGYTRGVLAMGWFRLVGPEVLKGSTIEKDVDKGLALITSAAEKGDTRAQLLLAYAYAPGFQSQIPVTKDSATALLWIGKAQARLARYRSVCTDPALIERMVGSTESDLTRIRTNIQAVRSDEEVVCSVDGDDNSIGVTEHAMRLMARDAAIESMYDVVNVPGTDLKFPRRQRTDELLAENGVKLAPLVEAFGKNPGGK
jgi:Sel1 repeat